ncbi:hypothetical protein EGM97_10795 [Pseudomonas sp. AF32]|nr:hypothetical protein [Pseudomonas sp. AF32]
MDCSKKREPVGAPVFFYWHTWSSWERACSRIGRYIQRIGWLMHRIREQARSHRGLVRKSWVISRLP